LVPAATEDKDCTTVLFEGEFASPFAYVERIDASDYFTIRFDSTLRNECKAILSYSKSVATKTDDINNVGILTYFGILV